MTASMVSTSMMRRPSLKSYQMSSTLIGAGTSTMGPIQAFKIGSKPIPKKSGFDRRESYMENIDSLMSHKRQSSVKPKFDGDPKKRTIVPLNLNDLGNWDNMDLMGSLRSEVDGMVKDGETATVHSG